VCVTMPPRALAMLKVHKILYVVLGLLHTMAVEVERLRDGVESPQKRAENSQ
jgi:hypothetical protein